MENKELSMPLAVRAQKCSFINMRDAKEVSIILNEISSINGDKALLEIISMPLMDKLFVDLAISRLMVLRLSTANGLESQLKLKVHKSSFPKEVLDKLEVSEQVELPLGKIICKGEYVFLFISSNHFLHHVVKFITKSTDLFANN